MEASHVICETTRLDGPWGLKEDHDPENTKIQLSVIKHSCLAQWAHVFCTSKITPFFYCFSSLEFFLLQSPSKGRSAPASCVEPAPVTSAPPLSLLLWTQIPSTVCFTHLAFVSWLGPLTSFPWWLQQITTNSVA